jgi:hypothetical protein
MLCLDDAGFLNVRSLHDLLNDQPVSLGCNLLAHTNWPIHLERVSLAPDVRYVVVGHRPTESSPGPYAGPQTVVDRIAATFSVCLENRYPSLGGSRVRIPPPPPLIATPFGP